MRHANLLCCGLMLFSSAVWAADPQPGAAKASDPNPAAAPIRVGVIGLDTSHSPEFIKLLNDPQAKPDLAGFRVVAAYPKGSPDIKSSVERVPKYTAQVQKMGVEIVGSIDELLPRVDVVLLETNDGRPHFEQALLVFKAKKPCFIDKPLAGSLADCLAIFAAAKKYDTPVFTASSLRYVDGAQQLRAGKYGEIFGCDVYSPAHLEATHPDLYWYGIHGVESLYTVMGPGCDSVSRVSTAGTDLAVGRWTDGRIGTFRGIRAGASGYGGTVFTAKKIMPIGGTDGYRPLVVEIAKFFRTRQSPVAEAESLEIYTFMEAADESKREGGKPIRLADVLAKAKLEAAKRKLD